MDFIVNNLPTILCLIFGLGLVVVEVFLPGFGLPGITGSILLIASIVLTWINISPMAALGLTLIVLAAVAIAITISLKSAANGRLSRSSIVLKSQEKADEGYQATVDMDVFIGREGVTTTVLRPAGMADFDGVRLNVVSEGNFIAENVKVRIVSAEGSRILVKPIDKTNKEA
ncbi:MAG: NfeD family protein [Eubacteriales bacterium]|nr:NfeD family protein [Eubacteriales bacterium]MDD3882930.1 NfeD family protein [Eubacteriales bacterium]MDD4513523.1 NfeD family protein [Eubacteriales bacterium]